MPFYPSMPEVRPFAPFSSFISGFGAGQQLSMNRAKTAMAHEELARIQREKDAMEEFKRTGKQEALIPALTPQQAMMAKGLMTQQQLETGIKATQYFDAIRPELTYENYPRFRGEALEKFPGLAEAHFPSLDQIGDKKKFDEWKWDKARQMAQFKALPQVQRALMQSHDKELDRQSRERIAEANRRSREGIAAGRISGGAGGAGKPPTINAHNIQLFKDAVAAGKYPKGAEGWNMFLRDQAQAKQAGKEATPTGEARKTGIEARTKQTEQKTEMGDLKKRLTQKLLGPKAVPEPGAAAPAEGRKIKGYRDPATGKIISPEEYERIKREGR